MSEVVNTHHPKKTQNTSLGAVDDGLRTHTEPKVLMTVIHVKSWERSHIMADVWLEPTLRHCPLGIWQHP